MKIEQFRREKNYGAVLAIAAGLLNRELITPAEYHKIKVALIRKHRPVIGSLQDGAVGDPPKKKGGKM